jgi:hypothetical protein
MKKKRLFFRIVQRGTQAVEAANVVIHNVFIVYSVLVPVPVWPFSKSHERQKLWSANNCFLVCACTGFYS